MKPVKPRYTDTIKVDWRIPKRSKQIISLYAKYTKYDEEVLIEKLISEILEDTAFMDWLNSRRYQKKIQSVVAEANGQGFAVVSTSQEEELDF